MADEYTGEHDLAHLRWKQQSGVRLTADERRTLKKSDDYNHNHCGPRSEIVWRVKEAARVRYTERGSDGKRLTWEQVAAKLDVPYSTLASNITVHRDIFNAELTKLAQEMTAEAIQSVNFARLEGLNDTAEMLPLANQALRQVLTSKKARDSVKVTAAKHVRGTLGLSETGPSVAVGGFSPPEGWKNQATEALGPGIEIGKPEIEAGDWPPGEQDASKTGTKVEVGSKEKVSGQ